MEGSVCGRDREGGGGEVCFNYIPLWFLLSRIYISSCGNSSQSSSALLAVIVVKDHAVGSFNDVAPYMKLEQSIQS